MWLFYFLLSTISQNIKILEYFRNLFSETVIFEYFSVISFLGGCCCCCCYTACVQNCDKRLLALSHLSFWLSLRPSVRSSVRPSVHMEQLGSHCADFNEIRYLRIFRKSLEKLKVSIQYDKNSGYFTWRPVYIKIVYHWILLKTKYLWVVVESKHTFCVLYIYIYIYIYIYMCVFRNSCHLWDNVETYGIYIFFFRNSCHLWDNVETYGTARQVTERDTMQPMRCAC